MADKYIVVWVNENETQGKSASPMNKENAEAWRDKMNELYPEIKHEINKVNPHG